jgi:tetratricopeptide (TPR) repeat protein
LRLAASAERFLQLRAASFILLAGLATAGAAAERAPLLDGMGSYSLPAGTRSRKAQRFFDQGMVMAFGFNPEESARAFAAATGEDPACALCWWGLAWSLGPNINTDMTSESKRRVASALSRARALAPRASPRTSALIDALSRRHPMRGAPNALDEEGYAHRMKALAKRFPRDADIALLAAESILNLHPYDWWERDGTPKPWTGEIETHLDRATTIAPDHPGALHYCIHLYESSPRPAKALDAADRLRDLVPGSPHLLHMPAHIYMRTGRYADATAANLRSIEVDRRYLAQVDAQGAYRVGYAAHNHHFLWASAAMEGRSRVALEAARDAYTVACGPRTGDLTTATLQHLAALPLYALVRFGKWDEILHRALPPDTREPYPLAVFHFARGTAYARTGRIESARAELARLEAVAADPALEKAKVKNINTVASLAAIARSTLAAEIALAAGDASSALDLLRAAVDLEDGLAYDEPHLWLAPTRHALGAALLAAGRPAQAERAWREDLQHYPDNGWSLHGLAKSLHAQARTDEAAAVEQRFREAWRNADFALAP